MAKKNNAKAPEAEAPETAAAPEAETMQPAPEETAAPQSEPAEEMAAEPAEDGALEKLQKDYDDLNDRYLRMAAEYENFRRRSQRERENLHADAVTHAVTALLPTYDNLERALAVETADAEYKKGVEMTMTQLVDSLSKLGVTRIEADRGTTFDPNLHNAVMHTEDEELEENCIAAVFQQGFRIGDKVIRHAMVQVAN